MKSKNIAFLGILLFVFGLPGAAIAEIRQLAWSAVTTYTDGSQIEAGQTVSYKAYWTQDPWLAAETLRPLVSSTTATSATFDPASEGMVGYQAVYFTVKTVVGTGTESTFSAALPWTPPPAIPGAPSAPADLGITRIGTSTPSGTWQLSWGPVTTYANGTPIQGKTVRYAIFWTADAGLSTASLSSLASSTSETSLTFDPAASGMTGGQRVYFAAKAVLDTGEESALSAALSWSVSNKGPGAPGNGRIVRKNKK
ncbi:MAG TPA: hypothetical protein VJ386_03785 [Candidatus Deferrimicrobiaceae bacterium]|jgi:hypothetical protein|nr:hypothetical protein [Candidatus Deferrimicrobiaceae bacterium]